MDLAHAVLRRLTPTSLEPAAADPRVTRVPNLRVRRLAARPAWCVAHTYPVMTGRSPLAMRGSRCAAQTHGRAEYRAADNLAVRTAADSRTGRLRPAVHAVVGNRVLGSVGVKRGARESVIV